MNMVLSSARKFKEPMGKLFDLRDEEQESPFEDGGEYGWVCSGVVSRSVQFATELIIEERQQKRGKDDN